MKKIAQFSIGTKVFIALTILYLLFPFILPANTAARAAYNIDNDAYQALVFITRLPILAIWAITFMAFKRLSAYAHQIKDTSEGEGFVTIAKGMGWIAWGFILPTFISSLLNAVANSHPDFRAPALIITNYLFLISWLIAFTYIAIGTHNLVHKAKIQISIKHIIGLVTGLVILGVAFSALIASRLHGQSLGDSFNAFYLPNILVWATIVAPYLFTWFMGIFAAFELVLIAKRTSGIIYKQALQLLAGGLILVIASLCTLQYFRSIVPRTGSLTLGSTLLMVYLIYAMCIAGAIALVIGVQRLKRIEDI